MSTYRAIVQGLKQAVGSPRLILLLWLISVLYAVPATLMMRQALADSFGESLIARSMNDGFDLGWHAEFEARTGGFEETFSPTVSGPGPVFDALEGWWSGDLFTAYPGLVALGVGYAVLWVLLMGGTLDRLAHPQGGLALDRFFQYGGRFLPRFLGLALISGVGYFLIYKLAGQMYHWIETSSRDVTEERAVLIWIGLAAIWVVVVLSVIRMIIDYAKIALVLGEEHSVLSSLTAAIRFILRHPLRTLGITLGMGFLSGALLGAYAWLAPGAGQSTLLGLVAAFLFGQLYLMARLAVRLGLLGGQMSLYRSETSHD